MYVIRYVIASENRKREKKKKNVSRPVWIVLTHSRIARQNGREGDETLAYFIIIVIICGLSVKTTVWFFRSLSLSL